MRRSAKAKTRIGQRTAKSTRKTPKSITHLRSAVFLDRDGTLCEEVGYVNHIDRLALYPWATEAIRKLNQAGIPVLVATNQSGVARGYFSESLVREVHKRIAQELARGRAHVDAFYYCPHHPDASIKAYRKNCMCRKPLTGMMQEAAERFGIDIKSSFVVGDSTRDMEMGFNSGARTVLVLTGYGKGNYEYHRHMWRRQPDMIAENLLDAVEKILGSMARENSVSEQRSGAPASR